MTQKVEKPKLVLAGGQGRRITAADVARMFKSLTGKETPPEEMVDLQKRLDEVYAAQSIG